MVDDQPPLRHHLCLLLHGFADQSHPRESSLSATAPPDRVLPRNVVRAQGEICPAAEDAERARMLTGYLDRCCTSSTNAVITEGYTGNREDLGKEGRAHLGALRA